MAQLPPVDPNAPLLTRLNSLNAYVKAFGFTSLSDAFRARMSCNDSDTHSERMLSIWSGGGGYTELVWAFMPFPHHTNKFWSSRTNFDHTKNLFDHRELVLHFPITQRTNFDHCEPILITQRIFLITASWFSIPRHTENQFWSSWTNFDQAENIFWSLRGGFSFPITLRTNFDRREPILITQRIFLITASWFSISPSQRTNFDHREPILITQRIVFDHHEPVFYFPSHSQPILIIVYQFWSRKESFSITAN